MVSTQTIQSIEQAALRLQPSNRARLAHSLIASLGNLSQQQLDALWLDEAERRDRDMESGLVSGVPGEDVFSRIEAKYAR